MINPFAAGVRARQRGRALLAAARSACHAERERPVVLRDGSQVLIRQVQPADAALLADGFARLSTQSRRPTATTSPMRWNGRKWSQAAIPNPSPGTSEALGAVGATSATNAWAVGAGIGFTATRPLTLHCMS